MIPVRDKCERIAWVYWQGRLDKLSSSDVHHVYGQSDFGLDRPFLLSEYARRLISSIFYDIVVRDELALVRSGA